MKLFLIFVSLAVTVQQGTAVEYVAAVVEYQPYIAPSASRSNETIEYNVNEYVTFIEEAHRQQADIIVFPEYGLTGVSMDPKENAIEIPGVGDDTNYKSFYLQKLSNAAVEHKMYVVVNIMEKVVNTTKGTTNLYNTNIVFDRKGRIAAKYRKINLYNETQFTPGDNNQVNTFRADFGVTFGMFICFDMLFYNPSKTTVSSGEVRDIIYPTAWVSTLPYLHSLNFQHGYALANRVNLLAANLNNVKQGSGGSGIYSRNGSILAHYISGTPGSKLLVAKLGSNDEQSYKTFKLGSFDTNSNRDIDGFVTRGGYDPSGYTVKEIELSKGAPLSEKVCQRGFCCNFDILAEPGAFGEIYKLVVFDGTRVYDKDPLKVRVCALVMCDSSGENCASRSTLSTTHFQELSIKAEVRDEKGYFYQPASLRSKLTPLETLGYNETVNAGTRVLRAWAPKSSDVLMIGIYGRGGCGTLLVSYSLLFIVAIVKLLF